jgi:hypothetical protein
MLKNKILKKKAIQGAQAWVVQFIRALRKKAQACMFCDTTQKKVAQRNLHSSIIVSIF